MKRLKWVIATMLLAAVPVLGWVSIAHAQKFSNTIEEGRTVNSSLYSAGRTIDIRGTINGDVFCGGQTITISATVKGDVICAGQDVTIDGIVEGDVRVAGQLVTIKGDVKRSATVAAMSFSLDAGAKVGQDLTTVGDQANIKGAVGRDIVASGNNLIFNGMVGRNAKAEGATVRLKGDARIAGDFTYTSDRDVQKERNAAVSGDTVHNRPEQEPSGPSFSLGLYLFVLVGFVLIYVAIAFLFPQFLRRTSGQIRSNFLKSFLVGLAGSFLVPMLALGLIMSLIGIPLVFFALLAFLFASALALPIAAFYTGRLVFRDKQKSAVLIALAGGAILTTTYFFWMVGVFFIMLSYWTGLGALLLTLKDHIRSSDTETPQPPAKPKKVKAKATA